MDKKGYIRTLEAIIAIVIIFGFIISILPKETKNEAKVPEEVELTMKKILDGIQAKEDLRLAVKIRDDVSLTLLKNTIINPLVPQAMSYCFWVSDIPNKVCKDGGSSLPSDKTIYTQSRFLKEGTIILYLWYID